MNASFKIVWLWTDVTLWLMFAIGSLYVWSVRRNEALSGTWRRVFANPAAMASAVVLLAMLTVAALDSLHFRRALPDRAGATQGFDTRTESVLDVLVARLPASRENSYSMPLATHGFAKETLAANAASKAPAESAASAAAAQATPQPAALPKRAFPRLQHGGANLKDTDKDWLGDVMSLAAQGLAGGLASAGVLWLLTRRQMRRNADLPWRAALVTMAIFMALAGLAVAWSAHYHVLGTDRTGNDVLYQSLKSVRTAFVIGSLATIATLPLAMAFGITAGYFKGWADDLIQYLYTVLSSVPNILLIAACVLMMQVYLDKHPELFETGLERADLKIFLLCVILGVTGWAGLCRLLRAETMKLRELEYVQAATAFGVSHWRIMLRHIMPNVMHLVLITTVLEFSGLILYEAVLSYVGVGVDPSMNSFGGMINQARVEMSRDPVVWWSFMAAFVFMVGIVLAANLFADAVRDAFDPRARVQRPRLFKPPVADQAT
ncbi:MAG: ABC transporter permease [Burkholderiales bacterium]|nr:ABC transporter permease [Burkholderiales bacterium]